MLEMEAGGEVSRATDMPLLEPEDAAAVIRTAFGQNGWQIRARNTFKVHTLVAALWVARRECGSENMRDLLKWARLMRGKDK